MALHTHGQLFLTADPHFFHESIVRHCSRPFANAAEMNDVFRENWNQAVGPKDTVIVVGDLMMRCPSAQAATEFIGSLAGKIVLVPGNHDQLSLYRDSKLIVASGLEDVKACGTRIVLCHYMLSVWNGIHRGTLHCFGHSHGTRRAQVIYGGQLIDVRAMDVGVDTNNYMLYPVEEVVDRLLLINPPTSAGPE